MRRREVLKLGTLAALGAGFGSSCATRSSTVALPAAGRRFARVQVDWDRIIRTVVGLRPFRPSGFVIKAQRFGSKTVIHNYGHGGAGVTLSWGTSHMAVEEAQKTGEHRYAVIGCGALGLATARLLQMKGAEVTIYARDLPPHTTSNVAGAQWSPFSVADPDRQSPEFESQLARAARLSHRYFQDMVGEYYGVRWIENYSVSDTPQQGDQRGSPLRDLYPTRRTLGSHEHPFDAPHVVRFVTMLIEPPIYLNAVLRDFLLMGGKLAIRDFDKLDAILVLPEPVIMNCTGIGARVLFGDEELIPIKGQLVVVLPQPEIDYITLSDRDLYMFPRRDGILLGGTFERGEWSLDVNEEEKRRVVEGHIQFFRRMRA